MKTATLSKDQKLANKISTIVALVLGAAAIAYMVKAWLISAPHIF